MFCNNFVFVLSDILQLLVDVIIVHPVTITKLPSQQALSTITTAQHSTPTIVCSLMAMAVPMVEPMPNQFRIGGVAKPTIQSN